MPPPSAKHPAATLIQSLEYSGFPATVVKPWSLDTIWYAIRRGLHPSIRSPSSKAFCRAELADHVFRGFSLLLIAEASVLLFGQCLCISRLSSVPQTNRKDRLICDSTKPPPNGYLLLPPYLQDTPAVNVSMDRTMVPPSMQLGPSLPRIIK